MALYSPQAFERPDLHERPQPGSADAVLAGNRAATMHQRRVGRAVFVAVLVAFGAFVAPRTAQPASRYALTASLVGPAQRRHRPLRSHARRRPRTVRGPPALRQGPGPARARRALLHARPSRGRARDLGPAAQDRRPHAVVAHAHHVGAAVRLAVCARLPALRPRRAPWSAGCDPVVADRIDRAARVDQPLRPLVVGPVRLRGLRVDRRHLAVAMADACRRRARGCGDRDGVSARHRRSRRRSARVVARAKALSTGSSSARSRRSPGSLGISGAPSDHRGRRRSSTTPA